MTTKETTESILITIDPEYLHRIRKVFYLSTLVSNFQFHSLPGQGAKPNRSSVRSFALFTPQRQLSVRRILSMQHFRKIKSGTEKAEAELVVPKYSHMFLEYSTLPFQMLKVRTTREVRLQLSQ